MLHDPELVFLDEPTSALDPIGRRLVRDIIRQLKAEKKTVFLNSHLLSEVEAVCDRVAIIQRGEVIRDGTLEELLAARRLLDVRAQGITEDILARVREQWSVAAHEGESTDIGAARTAACAASSGASRHRRSRCPSRSPPPREPGRPLRPYG